MGKDGSKLDRELIELLNELRVALPGVQVLFAFLLTVPFSQRFATLTAVQRDVYFVAFIAASVATALLMAPTAYHRLRWRQYDKEHMLRVSNRMAIAGIAVIALAIGCVVYVIADLLFGVWGAVASVAGVEAVVITLWFGLPGAREIQDSD